MFRQKVQKHSDTLGNKFSLPHKNSVKRLLIAGVPGFQYGQQTTLANVIFNLKSGQSRQPGSCQYQLPQGLTMTDSEILSRVDNGFFITRTQRPARNSTPVIHIKQSMTNKIIRMMNQPALDDTPEATYLAAASRLQELNVGYLHIAEADWSDAPIMPIPFKQAMRLIFHGTLIYSGNYNKDKANQAISAGWADLIGFGRAFIANPDLPERLRSGYPLASLSHTHLFGGEAEGYTDYPVYTANQPETGRKTFRG